MIPLRATFRPLLIAPLGSVVVHWLGIFVRRTVPSFGPMLIFSLIVWCLSLAAAAICVLPGLIFVPRVRQPTLWVSAIWGGLASLLMGWIVFGSIFVHTSTLGIAWLAAAGVASGIVYWLSVRGFRAS